MIREFYFYLIIPCVEDKIFKRGVIPVKKKSTILAIGVAFVIGFIVGATVVLLKGSKDYDTVFVTPTDPSPIAKESPSIEITEKIEDLRETLKKDPENFSAWVKLGNLYVEYHRYREAIEAYSQYLSFKPDDPDVRTNMGILLRRLGDYEGAIGEFRKAAQSDQRHSDSRYYLGFTLLHDKQDVKEAIKAWEDYLKVEPKGKRASQVRTQIERLKRIHGGNDAKS
jgi:uncharacterized protein HemY